MDKPLDTDTTWYQATTLNERLALRQGANDGRTGATVDSDLAQQRLKKWKNQSPFTEDGYFAQRLGTAGISENTFLQVLGEPVTAVTDRLNAPPEWLAILNEAFTRYASSDVRCLPFPEAPASATPLGFLEAIAPLIALYLDRLRQGILAISQGGRPLPFAPETIEEVLFAGLPAQLLVKMSRTFVLELHVARLRGELTGTTSSERFQSFTQRLRQPEIGLAILREYPVLARQLVLCLDRWATFSLEFLQHLCADWNAIRTTFCPGEEPGVLNQINGGAGDRHRGGRSVIVAHFSSGFRIVYKPRPLAVDVHFQELLQWLNERGDYPSFRLLTILNRGAYGWVEFVSPAPCQSPAAVYRFYQRQGSYLALLYALEATDFHFENLIAAGEHPVLIDLESLFHPRVLTASLRIAEQLAGSVMRNSVLRIGLLPQLIWGSDESEGVDLSGLGAAPGQLTPTPVPNWHGSGTDEMRFVRERVELLAGHNRPTLLDGEVSAADYGSAIEKGFTALYQLLLHNRDQLLSAVGPLARFAEDEVRVILRPTRTYAKVLYESFHPDVLRNALDRDRLFDRLWLGVDQNPALARVIQAEQDDLNGGDIPLFITHPDTTHLWSSAVEPIPHYFDESGLTLVKNRLCRLSQADLRRQTWFIHASLTALSTGSLQMTAPRSHRQESPNCVEREALLKHARKIGDRLARLALRDNGEVTWIGVTLVNNRRWSLLPLGADLYSGLPGIALFLAYLGAITEETRYTELARTTVVTLQNYIEEVRETVKVIGAFEGWGGIIHTLTHLGTLWREPALLAQAEEITVLLPELIEQDDKLDVLAGTAGCAKTLINLYHCRPSAHTLDAARQCGQHLIAQASAMKQGVGWRTPIAQDRPLAGFSHGAAGIAWILAEVATLTGDGCFLEKARAGLAYERALFSPEARNWPDLRDPELVDSRANEDGQLRFTSAWCHGAMGIGLSRLQLLAHLDDPELHTEIAVALETTREQGFGGNHSLCHGDLGNLELLLQAGAILQEPRWHVEAKQIAAALLKEVEDRGWTCGIPGGVETPGLMTGLAGIGYGLLRLADPQQVPSILLLEPPRRH